ncbi:hypothetical protein A3Q56_05542 [Intoshia linei]|uniref:Ubiquitin-like protease family profile domain-containing protein n=1 Tax=Intoshia linei TaxID=1819745 RepID=A0A177AZ01_9BILA|nr:hypothetical protein A3Q56_05542 [Intoshia linei]
MGKFKSKNHILYVDMKDEEFYKNLHSFKKNDKNLTRSDHPNQLNLNELKKTPTTAIMDRYLKNVENISILISDSDSDEESLPISNTSNGPTFNVLNCERKINEATTFIENLKKSLCRWNVHSDYLTERINMYSKKNDIDELSSQIEKNLLISQKTPIISQHLIPVKKLIIPNLTNKMMETIQISLRLNNITKIGKYTITSADLVTVLKNNWLNDTIINVYFKMIELRNFENEKLPNVFSFNTFFYTKLLKNGYNGVKRWTRNVDIFSKSFILVPIHQKMHWCFLVIDIKRKRIVYFDSLGGHDDVCLHHFRYFLFVKAAVLNLFQAITQKRFA